MLKEALEALCFDVEMDGQTHRTKAKPGDLVAFERHFGRSLIGGDGNASIGFTEMMFLTFAALRRQGVYEGEFDDYCAAVDDIDPVETVGKADPPGGSPSPV